jgi:hypothetical protein
MDLSDDDVEQINEADRRVVDPPIEVDKATWSKAGQLDWWVKERQEWFGRIRGADGCQRWIKAVDPSSRERLTAMTGRHSPSPRPRQPTALPPSDGASNRRLRPRPTVAVSVPNLCVTR